MSLKNRHPSHSTQSTENSVRSDFLLERILEQLLQINDSIQEMTELLKGSTGQSESNEEETDDSDDDSNSAPEPR